VDAVDRTIVVDEDRGVQVFGARPQ
jgi:hypothetical protein